MKLFTPPRLFSSRAFWVGALILTQLLFVSLCPQSSSFVPHCGFLPGLQDAELPGQLKGCTHTFSTRAAPPLSLENWFSKTNSGSVEQTVRQVVIDIDRDGDPDLVAVTNLPRLLVWLNDGRGRFTSWDASLSLRSSKALEDADDSNSEDASPLLFCLETRPLNLKLVPLASTKFEFQTGPSPFYCLSQSSPRAPPSRTS